MAFSRLYFDVVIVGAGIQGCSIAYHFLQAHPQAKIAVIDRAGVGMQASCGAAGMLAAQLEAQKDSPMLDLCLASRQMFPSLVQDLQRHCDIDVQYICKGMTQIVLSSEQSQELRARLVWQRSKNLDCRWVESSSIAQLFPFIQAANMGAFWADADGQINSSSLTQSYAAAAKKLGAQFFEDKNCNLIWQGGNLAYVDAQEEFYADQYVIAGGAWTGQILPNIKVYPVQGQVITLQAGTDFISRYQWQTPLFLGKIPRSSIDCYAVPKQDGRLLLGATSADVGFNLSEDKKATSQMLAFIHRIIPLTRDFAVQQVWSGFRPATPDRLPILGLLPGSQKVWIASGHWRNGILLSPVTGKIMTELLSTGKSSLDIAPFAPERFN